MIIIISRAELKFQWNESNAIERWNVSIAAGGGASHRIFYSQKDEKE